MGPDAMGAGFESVLILLSESSVTQHSTFIFLLLAYVLNTQ